jgi:O-acetyl-ADP-ribose deacetylase
VLLEGCYRRCLELARERGVKSVAFPAISTGIYHYPKGLAAQIAVRVCGEMADACGVEEIEFVCFAEATATSYERLLGEA